MGRARQVGALIRSGEVRSLRPGRLAGLSSLLSPQCSREGWNAVHFSCSIERDRFSNESRAVEQSTSDVSPRCLPSCARSDDSRLAMRSLGIGDLECLPVREEERSAVARDLDQAKRKVCRCLKGQRDSRLLGY